VRIQELEDSFKGLADRNRLRILNLLCHGELCGCDIQHVLETSQPNVSRHLTYLKHVGLVTDRREGFRVFCRLTEESGGRLRGLFGFLREAFHGDGDCQRDLVRLKQAIQDGACTLQQIDDWPLAELQAERAPLVPWPRVANKKEVVRK
jgi:ArsR family transcriptional regulator